MSQLAVQNNLLLIKNQLLTTCCCEDNLYWEAIPCDAYNVPGLTCGNPSGCSYSERRYVSPFTRCMGDAQNVCECQLLTVDTYTYLLPSVTNLGYILANTNYSNITGTLTSGDFTLTTHSSITSLNYNKTFSYSDYNNLGELIDDINNWSPDLSGNPVYLEMRYAATGNVPNTLNSGIFTLASAGDTGNIPSQTGGLYLTFSGHTSFAKFDVDSSIFASNIKNALTGILPSTGIDVTEDVGNTGAFTRYFYITFKGDQCGIKQPKIGISYRWISNTDTPNPPVLDDGTYKIGWGQEDTDYVKLNHKSTTCPYEDQYYASTILDGQYGYAVYNSGLQCCPQKGAVLGPNQIINSGFDIYGDDFRFLETTIVFAKTGVYNFFESICYKISPFYFLFGKEGRFITDPRTYNDYYIRSPCKYLNSGNTCDDVLPCTCTIELFNTAFNDQVPWGPYGSYYYGIETEAHPAYSLLLGGEIGAGQNGMADSGFKGLNYAPSGRFRTMGTWTETTGLEIEFRYYKLKNFYIGTNPDITDMEIGQIDPGTIGSFTITSGNNGTGNTILKYSGMTNNFSQLLYDINNIKTTEVSGQSCSVFNFCGAAITNSGINDLDIPINKINNLSSELYYRYILATGIDSTHHISHPEQDLYDYSASTIYPSTRIFSDLLAETPNIFNTGTSPYANQPPPCTRIITSGLYPENSGDIITEYREYCRPFWTTLRGCDYIVTHLKKGDSFDPSALSFEVEVTGHQLYFYTTLNTPTGIVTLTTGIPLSYNHSGFTDTDLIQLLNGIKFTNVLNTGTYYPIVSTSGNLPYQIYFDDTSDYGFINKLIDFPKFDLFHGNTTLKTWVRNLCTPILDVDDPSCFDGDLPRCVPWTSPKQTQNVNCSGDNIVEHGWLITYGCNSYNCKTEWFIKANRCSCSTEITCDAQDGLVETAHPLNREKGTCDKLTIPTFYMCENNLHPGCTLPFLVKVPFQYLCVSGSNCYFGECWQIPLTSPCYVANCNHGTQVGYSVPDTVGCMANITDYQYMNDGYAGWCQYINPAALTKVRRRDIPKTYPPKSLLMERSPYAFCTNYVQPFDIGGDDVYPKYDAIGPLWPVVPPEYIIPDGEDHAGSPCMLGNSSTNPLFAYIRPMLKNEDIASVCDTGNYCGLFSIDCNTRCCGCGFICGGEEGGIDCTNSGPKRRTYYDEIFSQTLTDDGPILCNWQYPEGNSGPGLCNYGLACSCINDPLPATYPPQIGCYDGTQTTTRIYNITRSHATQSVAGYYLDESLQCQPVYVGPPCCWGQSGHLNTTIISAGCGGTCFWLCGSPPERACGSQLDCDIHTVQSFDCSLVLGANTYSTSSGITDAIYQCDDPCVDEFPDRSCTAIEKLFTETWVSQFSMVSDFGCGSSTTSWSKTEEIKAEGTPHTTPLCDGSITELGIYNGGGGLNYPGCVCSAIHDDFIWQGTITSTDVGYYEITNVNSQSCSFDNVSSTLSYEEIINFTLPFICGNRFHKEES